MPRDRRSGIDMANPLEGIDRMLRIGERERAVTIRDHMERGFEGDVLRQVLEETMAQMSEENPEAKCFVVTVHVDYERVREVIYLYAYREVSHAVAHLVLCNHHPATFHGEIDGYPDSWEWCPPSGIIRWIMASPSVGDSPSTKAYDTLLRATTIDTRQSTSTDMV